MRRSGRFRCETLPGGIAKPANAIYLPCEHRSSSTSQGWSSWRVSCRWLSSVDGLTAHAATASAPTDSQIFPDPKTILQCIDRLHPTMGRSRQPQRVLFGPQHGFEQERIVPDAAAAFHDGADFGGMWLEKGQAQAVEPGESLSQLDVRDAGFVFAKDAALGPVAGIFDRPMLAYGVRESFHANGQAADIISGRHGLLPSLNISPHGDSNGL